MANKEVWRALEEVDLVCPPGDGDEALGLVLLGTDDLCAIIDVELVKFEGKPLGLVIHLDAGKIDLASRNYAKLGVASSRGLKHLIDPIAEWMPLL